VRKQRCVFWNGGGQRVVEQTAQRDGEHGTLCFEVTPWDCYTHAQI
jgi:hypothetical protein